MISLTCDYHPGAPHDATIHHVREILSSGTHVSSSQKTKRVEVIFRRKSGKKQKRSLLPLRQKSQRVENQNFGGNFSRRICLLGPKIHSSAKTGSLSIFRRFFFGDENFHQKILPKKCFRRRKMKCWESSETRFGKVSGRSEPSSRGKRPFKVCRVRCRAGFSSPTRVGDRFDLCRGIPYALRQA